MNISEANDWFKALRALETTASGNAREDGFAAARRLTERANKALSAGPNPDQVRLLVFGIRDAVDEAADHGVIAELGDRTVKTVKPAGGVL